MKKVIYFISYTSRTENDKKWAKWSEWFFREKLDGDTFMQEYDIHPGDNFEMKMHEALQNADFVVCVLSHAYLDSAYCTQEWTNADHIIPIKFDDCNPKGLLKKRNYIDLCGLDQTSASERLIFALEEKERPIEEPDYPVFTIRSEINDLSKCEVAPEYPVSQTFSIYNLPDRNRNSISDAAIAFNDKRVSKLIQDLKSTDRDRIVRAMKALAPSGDPWLTQELAIFVSGNDEYLADHAIMALRQIPGTESARVIALGLCAPSIIIRKNSAFNLGEMALLGRRQDSIQVLSALENTIAKCEESLIVLDETIHSISKIGGAEALEIIGGILNLHQYSAPLKARALHSPGIFWKRTILGDHPSALLYEQFCTIAKEAITRWSADLCVQIKQTELFDSITLALREAVLSQINKSANTAYGGRTYVNP